MSSHVGKFNAWFTSSLSIRLHLRHMFLEIFNLAYHLDSWIVAPPVKCILTTGLPSIPLPTWATSSLCGRSSAKLWTSEIVGRICGLLVFLGLSFLILVFTAISTSFLETDKFCPKFSSSKTLRDKFLRILLRAVRSASERAPCFRCLSEYCRHISPL